MPTKVIKKILEELKSNDDENLKLVDQGITNILEISEIFSLKRLTRLTLSHNKLSVVPAQIAELVNLEQLNLANNQIEELPTTISSFPKLKILKLCFNRLSLLPRGFGAFPELQILDLTSNHLTSKSFPNNFYELKSLRALYLADNRLDSLSSEIFKLETLNILVLRDNELVELPSELEHLKHLKELHVQSNKLRLLDPGIAKLELFNSKAVFKADNNNWAPQIADSIKIGLNHLVDYLTSEEYLMFYKKETDNLSKLENSGTANNPAKSEKAKKK